MSPKTCHTLECESQGCWVLGQKGHVLTLKETGTPPNGTFLPEGQVTLDVCSSTGLRSLGSPYGSQLASLCMVSLPGLPLTESNTNIHKSSPIRQPWHRPPGILFPPRGVHGSFSCSSCSNMNSCPPSTNGALFVSCLVDDTCVYSYSPFSWSHKSLRADHTAAVLAARCGCAETGLFTCPPHALMHC